MQMSCCRVLVRFAQSSDVQSRFDPKDSSPSVHAAWIWSRFASTGGSGTPMGEQEISRYRWSSSHSQLSPLSVADSLSTANGRTCSACVLLSMSVVEVLVLILKMLVMVPSMVLHQT